jgi:hypothetical protein
MPCLTGLVVDPPLCTFVPVGCIGAGIGVGGACLG